MAEINTSQRISTRVDMTPMVDLGFLLITFFILTASLSKPKMMEMAMPDKDNGHNMSVDAKRTITLLLDDSQKIQLYRGVLEKNTRKETLTYRPESFRKRLTELKEQIQTTGKDIIIIKASQNTPYKYVVDVLDEMSICQIQRYAIVDISQKDLDFMKR